jgi:hypothetical protein
MSRSAALTSLAALFALAGCFQLSPRSCEVLCTPDQGCPGDFQCMPQAGSNYGLCASPGMTCPPLFSDAGGDQTMDAGASDAEAGAPLPPDMLCHNGTCFTLPDAVRSNLVLLLWPSNLPPVGSTVSLWADQSGNGNDAHALYPTALPQVIADGVHLDPTQTGDGFVVNNSPALDFASGDFALIAVAGLSSGMASVALVKKSDGARTNSRQITIEWTLSSPTTGRPDGVLDDTTIPASTDMAEPSVAAYTLYRSTDHIELHVNGAVVSSADLPAPGMSTTNSDDVYVGVGSMVGSPADSIEAVIAVRGTVGATALNQLELFLRDVFAH